MAKKDTKGTITLKDLLHTIKVDDKKADKVDIKIGAENDLAIEKDKKGDDVYAGGLKEKFLKIGGQIDERFDDIDHSTLKLKSNIAQKWTNVKDMSTDIYDWFRASIVASGPEMGDEIYDELEAMMKLMDELLDDLD
jgi:hypothetical protein